MVVNINTPESKHFSSARVLSEDGVVCLHQVWWLAVGRCGQVLPWDEGVSQRPIGLRVFSPDSIHCTETVHQERLATGAVMLQEVEHFDAVEKGVWGGGGR